MNFSVESLQHYLYLMRLDKPIGWLLLMWPTLWACWLVSEGRPDTQLVWIFAAGVIVMRSAGCVINDYADRDFDPQVERTKTRPLAAGVISPQSALTLFAILIVIALLLLAMLPSRVWPWSVPAAAITVIYPYMKRVFQAPQLVLGIAFTFGVPMVYVAFNQPFDHVFWMLVLCNICWVIAYDTIYAMSDREDDLKIGVRSSAILFGRFDRLVVGVLQMLVLVLLIQIGLSLKLANSFFLSVALAGALFVYQQVLIRERERLACFNAFLNNGWLGGFVWFGFLTAF